VKYLIIIGLLVVPLLALHALDVITPNANALVEGDWNNGFPFSDFGSVHYQQVYDASQFTGLGTNGGMINFIGFRYHGNYNTAPMLYISMSLSLSTTTKAVDNLSATFADNIGPDNATVYSGKYTIGVTPPPSDHQLHPWPFPMVITFTTPFFYNPTNGNLLVDMQWPYAELYAGVGPPWIDAVEAAGDSVSRVFAVNNNVTYIPTNGTADTIGLVTLFGLTPKNPPIPRINNLLLSGTNLVLAGGSGVSGGIGFTLATTNLAEPLANWSQVNTNSFGTNGGFTFTNGVDPTLPQQFYILELQ
jgi:hypothetical protein